MSKQLPISVEFADLFDGLPQTVREAVEQVLAVHRHNGMFLTRGSVADAIAYATGTLSEADYDQRAIERAAAERGRTGR